MSALLAHFKRMQEMCCAFVEPTATYTDLQGRTTARGPLERVQRNDFFVSDMIYMLDGPEQRAAEAEEGPKVGDGTGDAALAIAEHAFKEGWHQHARFSLGLANDPGELGLSENGLAAREAAWDRYDPPEEIKALS